MSETSWAYVITDTTTDPDQPHKYVAFDDAAVATLAVDDPTLYYDCPVDYTAQCGFDVLAHASEPYLSRLNFQPSLGNVLHAIRLTAQHLRQATWNPQELSGREGMMYAQYIAAQAFNSGDAADIDRITNHVLGDACTPGNAKECTFETVRPVVEHCLNGDLDDLLG